MPVSALLLLRVLYDSLHVGLVLLGSGGLVDKVYIMEAVVLETDLLHDLEACVHLVLGPLESGSALVPGKVLVPPPNWSPPSAQRVCHHARENFSQSFIFLPATTCSGL